MKKLPLPDPGRFEAERFVAAHFSDLVCDDVLSSRYIRGGQLAADQALGSLDITGYAKNRSFAYPESLRGASGLSPWISSGLLSLPEVWQASESSGSCEDRKSFQSELLWQEYARHWFARLGELTEQPLLKQPANSEGSEGYDRSMGCVEITLNELEEEGWLVNQTRLWLSSIWTNLHNRSWADGEKHFYQHLIDGSSAANRLGWQWASGVGSSRPHSFSRWQVEEFAPGLCASCELVASCPIEAGLPTKQFVPVEETPLLVGDPDLAATAGPLLANQGEVDFVWMSPASLGDRDPALIGNPEAPVVFVFDESDLASLKLSSKRIIFWVETLAELATRRRLEIWLGDPVESLKGQRLSATFVPDYRWRKQADSLDDLSLQPWRWLVEPSDKSVRSFSAWFKQNSSQIESLRSEKQTHLNAESEVR